MIDRCKFLHNLPCEQVSERITALETENENLLKTVDSVMPSLIEDNARLKVENAKLRKLARGLNWCTENAKVPSAECERCPLGDTEDGELSCEKLMRELRIEVKYEDEG